MINTYLKYLLHEKNYSEHTILSYKNDLLQVKAFATQIDPSLEISDLNHKTLRTWIVSLIEEKISPRSVNRKIATLRSFYKFLHTREIINSNPAIKLKPLKTDKPLPEFVQKKEMDLLLDKVDFSDDFFGLRDKLILELFYGTGIRLSELIHISDRSISLYDNTVKVLGKKK